jgi:cystathionine beta-lyase/cystathionine gamma-synthase
MESTAAADLALSGESGAFVYRRDGHPNERTLAEKLALLHGASRAVITAQGMSAIGAVALATLAPGAQVWIGDELYGKSSKLFCGEMARWNVTTRSFDVTSAADIAELAASRVALVLIETLSNPRLHVPDMAAIAAATHAAGGLLMVDNTFATHLLCQPLRLGADLVIESLSKQVNGHSDSMLGLVAGKDAHQLKRIQDVVSTFGLASSPLDCYLTHRGLMSLAVRMERACANALALASKLSELAAVETVDYPGLPHHPQHALAARQLRGGFGWMLSFRIKANDQQLQHLLDRLKPEIQFVPSLGDVSTTVSHPASTSHRSLSAAARGQLGIGLGTIRVSCGIEPTDWLVERFLSALA